MDFQHPAVPFMFPPEQIIHLPVGSWAISYDISTPRTERDLPHGWNARRGEPHDSLFNYDIPGLLNCCLFQPRPIVN